MIKLCTTSTLITFLLTANGAEMTQQTGDLTAGQLPAQGTVSVCIDGINKNGDPCEMVGDGTKEMPEPTTYADDAVNRPQETVDQINELSTQ